MDAMHPLRIARNNPQRLFIFHDGGNSVVQLGMMMGGENEEVSNFVYARIRQ
jgi:hypothetical protein